jgi:hypothetical protein
MNLLNLLMFSIGTCAFVMIIAGLFWVGERLFGNPDHAVYPRHLPLEHPEDQR